MANRAAQFATHEPWLGTNLGTSTGAKTWLEIGMIAGSLPDGGPGFEWFWGDGDLAGLSRLGTVISAP